MVKLGLDAVEGIFGEEIIDKLYDYLPNSNPEESPTNPNTPADDSPEEEEKP